MSTEPSYTDFEKGERAALLAMRSFIIEIALRHKGKKLENELDAYCAQRLHDIRADALRN